MESALKALSVEFGFWFLFYDDCWQLYVTMVKTGKLCKMLMKIIKLNCH